MLSKGLYKLVESTHGGDKYTYRVELIKEHAVYKGHFPNMPVLPGVCTLHIIKSCLSGSLGKYVRLNSIKECKFLIPITPQVNKELIIEAELKDGILSCMVYGDDKVMLKLKGNITE